MKDNIIIKMENILEVTDGDRSKIENRIGNTPINLLIEGDWEMHQERNRIFSIILIERLEAVVGEVAVLLHEKLIKEVSKNETL